MYVYTQKEIEAFVKSHLLFGGLATTRMDSTRRQLAGIIAMLPPWQQSIIIEKKIVHVAGDYAFINYHGNKNRKEKKSISGFFAGGRRWFGKHAITDGVFFTSGADPFFAPSRTVWHEQGHLIDILMGDVKEEGRAFYSTLAQHWRGAIRDDIEHYDEILKSNPLPVAGFAGEETRSDNIHGEIQYDGYRVLKDHLALYDKSEEHPAEAFAEISTHYASLYAKTGGDEKNIDRILSRTYPLMWKIFKTEVLDRAVALANALDFERKQRIADYLCKVEGIFREVGRPFNIDAFEKRIKLADAAGQYEQAMAELVYVGPFLRSPVNLYVSNKEVLDGQHEVLREISGGRAKPGADAAKEITHVIEHKGWDVAVVKYLALIREVYAAQKFNRGLFSLSEAMGGRYDAAGAAAVFQSVWGAQSAYQVFKKNYEHGGLRRIEEMVAGMPSKFDIEKYVEAQKSYHTTRAAHDPQFSLEKYLKGGLERELHEDIYNSIQRPFESLHVTAEQISRKDSALVVYAKWHNRTVEKIAAVTGADNFLHKCNGPYPDFIKAYEDDWEKISISTLAKFSVTKTAIKAYVDAYRQLSAMEDFRTELSNSITWCVKDNQYRVVTRPKDFTAERRNEAAEAVMESLLIGGAEGLEKTRLAYLRNVHSDIQYLLSAVSPPDQWNKEEGQEQLLRVFKCAGRGRITQARVAPISFDAEPVLRLA